MVAISFFRNLSFVFIGMVYRPRTVSDPQKKVRDRRAMAIEAVCRAPHNEQYSLFKRFTEEYLFPDRRELISLIVDLGRNSQAPIGEIHFKIFEFLGMLPKISKVERMDIYNAYFQWVSERQLESLTFLLDQNEKDALSV